MADRRITRQDMKKDEFVDTVERWTHALEDNWKQVAAIGGGLAAVVLIAAGGYWWHSSSLAEAREALARASATLDAPIVSEGANPADTVNPTFSSERERSEAALNALDAFEAQHGAGPDGLAAYYRGIALLRLSRGADAEASFSDALAAATNPTVRGLVRQGMASAASEQGDDAKAETILRELSTEPPAGYPQDLVLFELSRVLDREGKTDEAEQVKQRLRTEHPDSPLVGRIRTSAPVPVPPRGQ